MPFAVEFSGPRHPLAVTPPRRAGSVRRTTTIDVARDDLYGPGRIDARARDLATGPDGSPTRQRDARLSATVDQQRVLTSLTAIDGDDAPPSSSLATLVGVATTAGFRREVRAALGADVDAGTLWHLLLDDLVGAVLVSGASPQHAEERAGGGPIQDATREFSDLMFSSMSDICAGWATDAVMLTEFRRTEKLPVACGPVAPILERPDDPSAWHATGELPPHAVRRRRCLDVWSVDGASTGFDVHFRDSHMDEDGTERCIHEYRVTGTIDPAAHSVDEIRAEALVLPWRECPGAVGSEQRLVGRSLSEVRDVVRAEFRGTSTCTHLNDTLRSLADLGALASFGGLESSS